MHMLMKCKSIPTDDNRLALFDPVYPREVPTNLSQHSLHRTVGRGWFDDDCREFFRDDTLRDRHHPPRPCSVHTLCWAAVDVSHRMGSNRIECHTCRWLMSER